MPNIPGQNLLNMALTVIQQQTVQYYQYSTRSLNAVGQDVTVYLPVVNIVGSWQPVPKDLYQAYGLDLQKEYFTLYTSNDVLDINRDVSGDQVVFNGRRYQCQSDVEWFALDGWKAILCVYIGSAS